MMKSPAIAVISLFTTVVLSSETADAYFASKCLAAKRRAAGISVSCLLNLQSKEANGNTVDPAKIQACKDKMTASFTKAEDKEGCNALGNAPVIQAEIDTMVNEITTTLSPGTPNKCQASKVKLAGKAAKCVLFVWTHNWGNAYSDDKVASCYAKMNFAFGNAEEKLSCGTAGDGGTIVLNIEGHIPNLI